MTINLKLFGSILLLSFLISCKNHTQPKDFDYGRVENNTYSNSYFNLVMKIPSNWIVQSNEQTENLSQKGQDLVAGDDKNLKAALKNSEVNSANLLTIFQYEIGSPVDYNPSFMLTAENLKNMPGVKTGSDYLFQVNKLLKLSQLKYSEIDDEFEKESINGTDFYTMNSKLSYMGLNIKQIYYSTIQNEFSLGVVISFINDEQKIELSKIINSMDFRK